MLKSNKKKFFLIALAWIAVGVLITLAFDDMWERTSTNESCMSCHVHEKADNAWKQSKHHSSNNKSGVTTDCAACHLVGYH